ncbi:hypothetical protein Ddye_006308 [Dipteronia dyeriana]|uniref:RNase H type-1 domain-containing protein n=1 Tax=Dipteronia dyeriana TaxID=168575 RepID=A0AAD9XHS9_9ROSI|nr:hypothetical protein Ddye_006308 [Dipteronia dyeriana]
MFSLFVGVKDSNAAEILAIHKAMDLCSSVFACMGRNLVIESDSKIVISWINSKGIGNVNHVQLIYDIRDKLQFLSGVVKFRSRASNQFADNLTKLGSSIMGILLSGVISFVSVDCCWSVLGAVLLCFVVSCCVVLLVWFWLF